MAGARCRRVKGWELRIGLGGGVIEGSIPSALSEPLWSPWKPADEVGSLLANGHTPFPLYKTWHCPQFSAGPEAMSWSQVTPSQTSFPRAEPSRKGRDSSRANPEGRRCPESSTAVGLQGSSMEALPTAVLTSLAGWQRKQRASSALSWTLALPGGPLALWAQEGPPAQAES